jgi:hypothetical protein
VFETRLETRRLQFLNSLLRTLDRLNVRVSIDGREARTLVAHVGDFSVGFRIDGVSVKMTHTKSHLHRSIKHMPQRTMCVGMFW